MEKNPLKMTIWNMASNKVLNFSNNVVLYVRVYMRESFCKISSQLKKIVDARKTEKNMPSMEKTFLSLYYILFNMKV